MQQPPIVRVVQPWANRATLSPTNHILGLGTRFKYMYTVLKSILFVLADEPRSVQRQYPKFEV